MLWRPVCLGKRLWRISPLERIQALSQKSSARVVPSGSGVYVDTASSLNSPTSMSGEAIRVGRFIEILRPDATELLPVHGLFEASRSAAAGVRAFVDTMRDRCRTLNWR